MYYKCKKGYNTFGLDGIKSHVVRFDYDIRALKLENALLTESLKKDEKVIEMDYEYIDKKLRIS